MPQKIKDTTLKIYKTIVAMLVEKAGKGGKLVIDSLYDIDVYMARKPSGGGTSPCTQKLKQLGLISRERVGNKIEVRVLPLNSKTERRIPNDDLKLIKRQLNRIINNIAEDSDTEIDIVDDEQPSDIAKVVYNIFL